MNPNINTYSFLVALGSVLHVTMRQAAPGKWTSVVVFVSVTGYSSNGNISGAVCNKIGSLALKGVQLHEMYKI